VAREKLTIPRFKTEAQEAAWWWRNRKVVEADLRIALREGKTVSLHDVLARAKKHANSRPASRGIKH
jgi:hypothetical protein